MMAVFERGAPKVSRSSMAGSATTTSPRGKVMMAELFGVDLDASRGAYVFAGDSPNIRRCSASFPRRGRGQRSDFADAMPHAALDHAAWEIGICRTGAPRSRRGGGKIDGRLVRKHLHPEFVTLFVIRMVATLPVFWRPRSDYAASVASVAAYAMGVSFVVLLFFIAGGQFPARALKIPMPSAAGSIVLLLFGLSLVLGGPKEVAAMPADATLLGASIHWPSRHRRAGAILTVVR